VRPRRATRAHASLRGRDARLLHAFCRWFGSYGVPERGDAAIALGLAVFTGRIWRNRALGKKAFGGPGLLESDFGYVRATEAFNPGDAY